MLGLNVFRNVGVEQVKLHPSDIHAPDFNEQRTGRQLHLYHHILAAGILNGADRQSVEIVHRIALLLPSIRIERLLQVALLIKQPYSMEKYAISRSCGGSAALSR